MLRRRRVLAIGGSIAVLGVLVVGAVGATSSSSDEAALAPAAQAAKPGIDAKVENLLRQMTLTEKLEQLQLLADFQVLNRQDDNGPRRPAWDPCSA